MKKVDTNGQDEEILIEDRCICCGGIVPEGYMVCHGCIMEQGFEKKVNRWKRKQFVAHCAERLREAIRGRKKSR